MQERGAFVLTKIWAWLAVLCLATACASARPEPPKPPQAASTSLGERCALGTLRLLQTLDQPLRIELYITSEAPVLDGVEAQFERVARAYAALGVKHVQARVVRVVTDADLARARAKRLAELTLGAPDGRRAGAVSGFLVEYGKQRKVVPLVPPERVHTLPYWLATKVREVVLAERRQTLRIGIATGKNELRLDAPLLMPGERASVVSVIEAAFPHYDLTDVDLRKPSWSKADLRALIVTQPGSAYTEAELRGLDRFVLSGDRSLVVATSATRLRAPQSADSALLESTSLGGLERLLEGYGMKLHRDLIGDSRFGLELRIPAIGGEGVLRHPSVLMLRSFDSSFAPFAWTDELAFPFPSSLELDRQRQPADVELYVVARASGSAEVTEATPRGDSGRPAPTPVPGAALAAVAQGKLKSAFGTTKARAPSRVLVLGSAFFFTNPFTFPESMNEARDEVREEVAQVYAKRQLTSMLVTVKDTLDWMTTDSDLLACLPASRLE